MTPVLELVERALASGNPQALALAHKLLKNPLAYKSDPVGYIQNVLGVRLWSRQVEIANALVEHKRVIVESANAIGKTLLCAALALWFHATHVPSQTLITGPNARQIQDVTFKEIRRLYRGPGLYPKNPRIQTAADHLIHGFTALDSTAFQGIHGDNLFVIFEECVGVEAEFWEAAKGILAGGEHTYMLAVCNPTDSSAQARIERDTGNWHVVSVSAFDHPNISRELNGLPPLIPGAIRLEQLRALIAEWCQVVNSDPEPTDFEFEGVWYRPGPIAEARLLGRYPTQGSYSIYTEHDFARALEAREPQGEVEIGCFVAGTLVETADGPVPIDRIKAGTKVLTRQGYKAVRAAHDNGVQPTLTITCEDGRTLTGTGNHPIWDGKDWCRLDSLTNHALVYAWNTTGSNTTASSGIESPEPGEPGNETTTGGTFRGKATRRDGRATRCTDTFGKSITGRSRMASASTTRTRIRRTTKSQIWSASPGRSTVRTTPTTFECSEPAVARYVARSTGTSRSLPGSARTSASVPGDDRIGSMTSGVSAVSAVTNSPAASTSRPRLVPVRVLTKSPGRPERVFNLTVEDCPEYFANGILVHNCDVARFGNDNTTIHVQQGGVSLYHESVNRRDTAWVAARVKELADRFAGDRATKVPIRIDSTGVGGGVVDQRGEYNFIEINASQTAREEDKYPNVRSELLFSSAEHMRAGKMSLARLTREQVAEVRRQALGITYKLDAKGRRVAERKDEIKKRIGRSPDDLDALTLAYLGKPTRFELSQVLDVFVASRPTADQIKAQVEQQKTHPNVEDSMDVLPEYKQVAWLRSYGTYQSRPAINNGNQVPLCDFPKQHEAAFAVEVAHKLLGLKPPHTVPAGRVTDERKAVVQAEVEKKLRERKLYPVPTPVKAEVKPVKKKDESEVK